MQKLRHIILSLPIVLAGISFIVLFLLIGYTISAPQQVITMLERLVPEPTKTPEPIRGIGILGDSQADEYRADDNRGLTYAPTTLNWVEQLQKYRNLNFGPWGIYTEPRRNGYAYNFSRTGATVNSMFVTGQVEGLAAEIKKGNVNIAIVSIGANDFAPYITDSGYDAIYNGTLTSIEMERKKDQVVSDIMTAVDILRESGNVRIIIVLIPDWGNHLGLRLTFPLPEPRQNASDYVEATNASLQAEATTRGIVTVNPNLFYDKVFAQGMTEISVGDQKLSALLPSDDPRSVFLEDGTHAGTILNGLFANEIIAALNTTMRSRIVPFSSSELMKTAGL